MLEYYFGNTFENFDLQMFVIKAAFLLVIMILAFMAQRLVKRLFLRLNGKIELIPSASILMNALRATIWFIAVTIVVEPVFGIKPDALLATLGITSILISLGFQDTISNIIAGFLMIIGKVIQPGDYVSVSGITGTVKDISLRHTVVENRKGERIVVPNSVLNKTSVVCLPASSESLGTLEFTMDLGYDADQVAEDILSEIRRVGGDALRDDLRPKVVFDSITPYGVKGQVFFYLKDGIPFSGIKDKMVRSISGKTYFSQKGYRALNFNEEIHNVDRSDIMPTEAPEDLTILE